MGNSRRTFNRLQPTTHRAMYISGLQTLRVFSAGLAMPCGKTSYLLTKTKSLDQFFADQRRSHFVSQLNSVVPPASPVLIGWTPMAYTDDDGATWTPRKSIRRRQLRSPDGWRRILSASVPLGNAINKGSAIYYVRKPASPHLLAHDTGV